MGQGAERHGSCGHIQRMVSLEPVLGDAYSGDEYAPRNGGYYFQSQ